MSSSVSAYKFRAEYLSCSPYFRTKCPLAQAPNPMPAMNTESTIETSALVTPKSAMAKRSQMISYRMLQNPETQKKRKSQSMKEPSVASAKIESPASPTVEASARHNDP